MHGGAKGSGRPATTGHHTAQAERGRRFVRVVKSLLAARAVRPEPIEATPVDYDSGAVTVEAPPPSADYDTSLVIATDAQVDEACASARPADAARSACATPRAPLRKPD
jgi:hypothetical protein